MACAVSRLGCVAASNCVYCRAACSEVETEVGKITRAKMKVTIASRTTSVPTMMAESFENMDRRHRDLDAGSVIAASNEKVAGATHRADKGWMLRIIAEFLAKAADQHIDRAVESFPVDAARLI